MAISQTPIKIIEVRNGRALIQVNRLTICTHCHMIEGLPNASIFETWVENDAGADPGEFVRVQIPAGNFLLSIFMVFVLPLIGLIGGTLVAASYPMFSSGQWEAVFGLAGWALAYIPVRIFDRYASRRPGFLPSIRERVRIKPGLLEDISGQVNLISSVTCIVGGG